MGFHSGFKGLIFCDKTSCIHVHLLVLLHKIQYSKKKFGFYTSQRSTVLSEVGDIYIYIYIYIYGL